MSRAYISVESRMSFWQGVVIGFAIGLTLATLAFYFGT